jgi:hypothetical protein
MDTMNLSKNPTENPGPARSAEQRKLAVSGAIGGAIAGGVFFFFLFFTPTLFIEMPYTRLLVSVATVIGAMLGFCSGPLVSLRLFRLNHKQRPFVRA